MESSPRRSYKKTKLEDNSPIINPIYIKDKNIVAIYSHKGGVGKTTICVNLAKALIQEFPTKIRKLLLIDMDQQMNLSYFLTGHYKSQERKSMQEIFDDDLDDLNMKEFEERIDNLDDLNYGEMSRFDILPGRFKSPDILTKLRLFEQKHYLNAKNKDIINHVYKTDYNQTKDLGIDLIIGNHRLTEYTNDINHEIVGKKTGNYLNALRTMLDYYKKRYDLVIIDLPPDLYVLNKVTLLLSDYIVCVLNPDIFANITLKLMKKYFFEDEDIQRLIKENFSKMPTFSGYIYNKVGFRENNLVAKHASIKKEIDDLCLKLFDVNAIGKIKSFSIDLSTELNNNFSYIDESNINKIRVEKIKILTQFKEIVKILFI